jgi:hypothetical protein
MAREDMLKRLAHQPGDEISHSETRERGELVIYLACLNLGMDGGVEYKFAAGSTLRLELRAMVAGATSRKGANPLHGSTSRFTQAEKPFSTVFDGREAADAVGNEYKAQYRQMQDRHHWFLLTLAVMFCSLSVTWARPYQT